MDYRYHQIKVTRPLFERLMDDSPTLKTEERPKWSLTLYELRDSIMREINYLLNTRDSKIPFSLQAVWQNKTRGKMSKSYGLPDFALYDATNKEGQKKWIRRLNLAIELYEPRITKVQVKINSFDRRKQNLMIEVSGIMKADPLGERFTFPVHISNVR